MGRPHEVFRKADNEQNVTSRRQITTSSVNGRHVPDIRWDFRDFDGYVRMEVHPEDSDGSVVGGLPRKSTTEVTTNVMVKDGHTVVNGGRWFRSFEP